MRVAITGGLGFIGSHLAERFAAAGDTVLVIDDSRGAVVESLWPAVKHYSSYDVVEWCREAEPLGLEPFDLVVHCAAPVGPGLVAQSGGKIAVEIISATWAIGSYCAEHDIPLVNISSSEVYGATRTGAPDEDEPIGHFGPFSARSEYGLAKATAECLLANMPGLRHCSIRPFNTVGPRQSSAKGFVLPTFVEQVKRNEPLTVYEPNAMRSLTSVHDVVDFIVGSWEALVERGGPWNLGNEDNDTLIYELAQRVINLHISETGSDGKWVLVDPRDRWGVEYEFFQCKDGVKIPNSGRAAEIGWKPTRDLESIVAETYRSIP